MFRIRISIGTFAIGMMVLCSGIAHGQDYPSKLVRVIAPAAGSGSDVMARLIAQGLSSALGQSVIVENRPSGVIPGETVAKSPPDGYTLLVTGMPHWLASLIQSTPYDPVADFSPISLTSTGPSVLVVHPSVTATSVKELITLAKGKPGELNYVGGATGGLTHLAGELFNTMAGIKLVRIPYKSGADETADLVGNRVQVAFGNPNQVRPYVSSGKLRALAVTSAKPSTLAPGLPAVAATIPGFVVESLGGVVPPAKTPATIINRLNQEIVRIVNQPELKDKFAITGVEPVGTTPEQFAATIKSELAKWGKVVKDAGIRID